METKKEIDDNRVEELKLTMLALNGHISSSHKLRKMKSLALIKSFPRMTFPMLCLAAFLGIFAFAFGTNYLYTAGAILLIEFVIYAVVVIKEYLFPLLEHTEAIVIITIIMYLVVQYAVQNIEIAVIITTLIALLLISFLRHNGFWERCDKLRVELAKHGVECIIRNGIVTFIDENGKRDYDIVFENKH